MTDREKKASVQAAYEAGQNYGYSNAAFSFANIPYPHQSEEYFAFIDGYEDGRDLYQREARHDG